MVHGPRAILHALPNWDDFRYFLAVARARTLAGAARDLKVEHTTVGRRLAALERALGTQLFMRGPDGFALTRAGLDILPLAEEISAQVDGIVRRVSGEDERVTGTVRVTTSEAVTGYLVRDLAEFRRRHPELIVEVLSGNRAFDRDVFLVVHPDLARVARVRAVMDFIVEVFRRDARLWDGTANAP